MARSLLSSLEVLEARIAPASLTVLHELPNIVSGPGKTGATIDLGNMFDAAGTYHTLVTFHTNFDSDPGTAGVQGDITIELFDDTAPLTVQDFLTYATNQKTGAGYLGTFFTRLVTSGGISVLQNSAFTASNFSHIVTGAPVHNEPGISNTMGTVAMAKAANQPNSATSDFFINLADNSQMLDTQNGGFTVFGKLVPNAVDDSLAVVQKIAQTAAVYDLTPNSTTTAFENVPTQGGYTGVSPTTGLPLPTPGQLFTITGVDIHAPLNGNSPGITYSVSVSNPGAAPGLVSSTVTGDLLKLHYKAGLAGVSTVQVTATNAVGDSATDSFNVTLQPNLISGILDGFNGVIVPGDTATATMKFANTGGGVFKGAVDVGAFLVDIGTEGRAAQPLGIIHNVTLNVASGAIVAVPIKLQIPTDLEVNPGEKYEIALQVIPPMNGNQATQLFSDDDGSVSGVTHGEFNAFGNFSGRVNVPLHYSDANHRLVTMTASGGGYGQVFYEVSGDATKPLDLELFNTSGATNILAAVSGGQHTTLGNVFVSQPQDNSSGIPASAAHRAVGAVNLGAVDLTGDFAAAGGVKSLKLGTLKSTDGTTHSIQLGIFSEAPGQAAAISLGNVTDYSLSSSEAISTLSVLDWKDVNATTEVIGAYFMTSFTDKGTLQADFTLAGAGTLKSFTVNVGLQNSEVQIGGNVGTVLLGGMDASDFLVGTTKIPTALTDFYAGRSIGSFTLKSSVPGGSALFSNSNVAAVNLGKVLVDQVDGSTGTGAFGFITDRIARYQHGSVIVNNAASPGIGDVIGNYRLTVL